MSYNIWVFVFMILVHYADTDSDADVIFAISKDFGARFMSCFRVMEFGAYVFQDVELFWRRDYQILNRGTGCAFLCMFREMGVITDDGIINYDAAIQYVVSKGGEDELIGALREAAHECETKIRNDPHRSRNVCTITQMAVECFRQQMFNMGAILEITRRIFNSFVPPPRCRQRRRSGGDIVDKSQLLYWNFSGKYPNGTKMEFSKYMIAQV